MAGRISAESDAALVMRLGESKESFPNQTSPVPWFLGSLFLTCPASATRLVARDVLEYARARYLLDWLGLYAFYKNSFLGCLRVIRVSRVTRVG